MQANLKSKDGGSKMEGRGLEKQTQTNKHIRKQKQNSAHSQTPTPPRNPILWAQLEKVYFQT